MLRCKIDEICIRCQPFLTRVEKAENIGVRCKLVFEVSNVLLKRIHVSWAQLNVVAALDESSRSRVKHHQQELSAGLSELVLDAIFTPSYKIINNISRSSLGG